MLLGSFLIEGSGTLPLMAIDKAAHLLGGVGLEPQNNKGFADLHSSPMSGRFELEGVLISFMPDLCSMQRGERGAVAFVAFAAKPLRGKMEILRRLRRLDL